MLTNPPTLQAGPTKYIAIAIQLMHSLPWHQNTYQGIVEYGKRHGWTTRVDPQLSGIGPEFDPSIYDGVVGRIEDDVASMTEALSIPTVNIRTPYQPEDQARVKHLPSVCINLHSAGLLAGEHLVACGYRRFGYIGVHHHFADTSNAGLAEVVESHGFGPIHKLKIDGNFGESRERLIAARQELDTWLLKQTAPFGIFVQHATIARFTAQACMELGLRVPEDVGIVTGPNDVQTLNAEPTLSSLEFDYYHQGGEAAALLDKLMQGKAASPRHMFIEPQRLVVRGSSDVFVSSDPLVSEAMRYIAERIRHNPSIDEVAEALDSSHRTLSRRFREEVGRPIIDEITRLRVDYLKRLLTETKLPLYQIANDCGYSSPSYLTHFFKRETGQTPSEYRQCHQISQVSND